MTFDRVAPYYDFLAQLTFGRALLRAQQWGIEQVPMGSRVLVLGGGTGATLPHLLVRQPVHVLYVESSAAMLAKARRRTPPSAPVTFVVGTEQTLAASERFDSILLPFVLDLYPVETLVVRMLPKLLGHLTPGGQLIVTDFNQPRTGWQRTYMWLMLRFFRFTVGLQLRRWTNWPSALQQAGLTERTGQSFRAGQVRSGCWARGG